MRATLWIILLVVMMLAACQPADLPPPATTAATEEAIATVDAGVPTPNIVIVTRPAVTPFEDGVLPIPPVGTLVAAFTEDPNADQGFEYILLTRTGSDLDPTTLTIEIFADRRYVFNGETGYLSLEYMDQINRALLAVDFFGLQGTFLGPVGDSGNYRYSLTVRRGSQERMVNSEDGFTPREYIQLLALISDLRFQSQ